MVCVVVRVAVGVVVGEDVTDVVGDDVGVVVVSMQALHITGQ